MAEDRDQRTRERAYALWEQEGRPHGRHEDHWRQASEEAGAELFDGGGDSEARPERGSLDGGLLAPGGLVAAGGPAGLGLGGLGMAGELPEEEDPDRARE